MILLSPAVDFCCPGPKIEAAETDKLTCTYSSLHPTQYPWEHLKWNKTFDHQA